MTEILVTNEGIFAWLGATRFEVLPVVRCVPCQGDRPVVPLAGGAYRCASCGHLFDPNKYQDNADAANS